MIGKERQRKQLKNKRNKKKSPTDLRKLSTLDLVVCLIIWQRKKMTMRRPRKRRTMNKNLSSN